MAIKVILSDLLMKYTLSLKYFSFAFSTLINVVLFFLRDLHYVSANFLLFALPIKEIFCNRLGLNIYLLFAGYILLNLVFLLIIFVIVRTRYNFIGWALFIIYVVANIPFINSSNIFI